MNGITIKCVLDPQSRKDKRQIKLRLTYDRKSRFYSIGEKSKTLLSQEEFERRRTKNAMAAWTAADKASLLARSIVDSLGDSFSFDQFYKEYYEKLYLKPKDTTLFSVVAEEYLNRPEIARKTKILYQTSVNWFLSAYPKVKIDSISTEMIVKLVNASRMVMRENTIRIYLRSLRAIFNFGIKRKYTKHECPFQAIPGISFSSIARQHAALDDDEWSQFMHYEPQNKTESFAKDFFVLCFNMYGANIIDILSLKNKNIVNGEVSFVRRKTRKTGKIISFTLSRVAENLLNTYGNIDASKPDDYILPYLVNRDLEPTMTNVCHDIVRRINKGLKSISGKLGLPKITTYTARHTVGSFFQAEDMTSEQAQKFFGHTSSKTTEIYMNSITTSVKKKAASIIDKASKSFSGGD